MGAQIMFSFKGKCSLGISDGKGHVQMGTIFKAHLEAPTNAFHYPIL